MIKLLGKVTNRKNGLLFLVFTTLIFTLICQVLSAEETTGEKIKANTNDVVRVIKKGSHRVNESICADKDLKCTSTKIKNRTIELKDETIDGAKKVKNKID